MTQHEPPHDPAISSPPGQKQNTWKAAFSTIFSRPMELLCLAGFLSAVLLPIVLGSISGLLENRMMLTGCNSGGACRSTVSIVQRHIAQIWDITKILDITIGFGELDFRAAKSIDLCWDLAVGRGGQLLYICIAYYTFGKAMICIVETHEASCDVYAATAFSTGSLGGTWTLLRHCIFGPTSKSLFARFVVSAMLLCGLYILALPTIISASTSYGARSKGQIKAGDDWIAFENWWQAFAVVVDGSRVGLRDGYVVPQGGYANDKALVEYYYTYIADNQVTPFVENSTIFPLNTTTYSLDYIFSQTTAQPRPSYLILNSQTIEIGTTPLKIIPMPPTTWFYKDIIVSPTNLNNFDTARCDATDHYQWGFSFLILIILSIINAFASALLYTTHLLTVFRHHPIKLGRHKPNVWRAVVDLSIAVDTATNSGHRHMDTDVLREAMKGQRIRLEEESETTSYAPPMRFQRASAPVLRSMNRVYTL